MTTTHRVIVSDALEALRKMPDSSVDSIVTDPPYGLAELKPELIAGVVAAWVSGDREAAPAGRGFMGKTWDAFVPPPAIFDEALRVLKPGGNLLAFAGSRTVDIMGLSIRLAGFEMRDSIAWLYGSGFPKSMNVAAMIDKTLGAEREVVGAPTVGGIGQGAAYGNITRAPKTASTTDEAREWDGWGTALKPAFEPVVVARKPFRGTVAANVLEHGTGALNIDACRVGDGSESQGVRAASEPSADRRYADRGAVNLAAKPGPRGGSPSGRWPTNVLMDGSQADALDAQTGVLTSGKLAAHHARAPKDAGILGAFGSVEGERGYGDSGGASRFFPTFRYQAKAPSSERPVVDGVSHPTVKPLGVMRWLVKLVTPPEGVVLDIFAGSGTTAEASLLEGFNSISIERGIEYVPLIACRLERSGATPTGSTHGRDLTAPVFVVERPAEDVAA